jgi:hypothetical protein
MIVRRIAVLALLCVLLSVAPAIAQYSHTLLVEAVRDPGRADAPRTATSLALGGVQVISGSADEAIASPGSLLLGQSTDVVLSGGLFLYARQELVNTPRQQPPFDASRELSPRSTMPIGFAAVATRRPAWAVAGFYDATSSNEHHFTTERANLFFTSLFPTFIDEHGTGEASVVHSVTRLGGSVAFGDHARGAGVGVSVYLARLGYVASATDMIDVTASSIGNPVPTTSHRTDRDRAECRDWAPGIAVSGMLSPVRHITLAARWRREPQFNGIRELSIEAPSRPAERFTDTVRFRLPRSYGVAAIVSAAGTRVVAEIARVNYRGTFSPLMAETPDPNYVCAPLNVLSCSGWNFPNHDAKDTTTVRAGVEQRFGTESRGLRLRGGIALEPGYTLARSAADPSVRRNLPAPPLVTPFEPPRESLAWFSGGIAYASQNIEVGVGLAHARNQTRLQADVRIYAQ